MHEVVSDLMHLELDRDDAVQVATYMFQDDIQAFWDCGLYWRPTVGGHEPLSNRKKKRRDGTETLKPVRAIEWELPTADGSAYELIREPYPGVAVAFLWEKLKPRLEELRPRLRDLSPHNIKWIYDHVQSERRVEPTEFF